MEVNASNMARELQAPIAAMLDREVAVTVGWGEGSGALVCLSGRLEGLVEVPGGEDAPLSIVVAGQDIMVWRDDLDTAKIKRDASGLGLTVEFASGLAISVDRTE
jgi:hypothetical protein